MSEELPLVSVGIASYNNARYIIETLDSVWSQTYKNIELIIVDDCSTDDSVAVINEWIRNKKERFSEVKFFVNEQNKGICYSCNRLLKNSHGKYFSLNGSDDIMLNSRIEENVKVFESPSNKYYDVVFSDMSVIDFKSEIKETHYYAWAGETYESIDEFLMLDRIKKLERTISKNMFPAPAMMYRTEILNKVGGWNEAHYFEDLDMNLKLINNDINFYFIPEPLILYRVHERSVSYKPDVYYIQSVLNKVYNYKGMSPGIDTAINNRIKSLAMQVFHLGGSESNKWLRKSFTLQPSLKLFFWVIYSFFGLKYSMISRTK